MKILEISEIVHPEKINSTCFKRGDVYISRDSKYAYFSLSKAKNEGFKVSEIKFLGIPIRIRMSTNIETFNN